MSDGKYYWLKLKRDFFKRHDIHILNGMEYGREVVLFYIKLMLESIDHEGELRFSERLPYSNSMLANLTDTPESIVDTSMEVLQDFKLIEIDENGTIILPKVMEMIGFETDWAKKKREYRDKRGQSEDNERTNQGQCPDNVLPMSDKSIEIRDKSIEIRDKSIERESKERETHPHFMPPTVEEVYLYCEQRHNGIDAQRFVDYYTAKGWKNITDWKAQIRVWESRKEITE
jgi:phage replisome organizer, putative, N-terminal region